MEKNKGRDKPTSLKQTFQGLQTKDVSVLQGKVTQESPIKIQVLGDDKLILNENTAMIPWHLTDYETAVDISLAAGSLDSKTASGGGHGGHEGPETGDHVNDLETFTLSYGKLKVYNHLKAGELVWILSFNAGKRYLVLDRIVGQDTYGGADSSDNLGALLDQINNEVI